MYQRWTPCWWRVSCHIKACSNKRLLPGLIKVNTICWGKCQTVSISNSRPTQQVVRYWEKCFLGKLKSFDRGIQSIPIQHRRCTSLVYERERRLAPSLARKSTVFIFTWLHAAYLGCPKLILWTLFFHLSWSWFLLLQKRLSATFDDRHGNGEVRWWLSCTLIHLLRCGSVISLVSIGDQHANVYKNTWYIYYTYFHALLPSVTARL